MDPALPSMTLAGRRVAAGSGGGPPATGTSTVETCPNNSGQPNCGVAPETLHLFSVTPSAGCGQNLNVRFLVDAEHNRVFRRTQIQTYHVGGLWSELWIRGDAPTSTALQLNLMLS